MFAWAEFARRSSRSVNPISVGAVSKSEWPSSAVDRGAIVTQSTVRMADVVGGFGDRPDVTAPAMAVQGVGALLALAVAAVHIADQSGIGTLAEPDWVGWGYRLIEIGGVLTALALLLRPPRWGAFAWIAAVLLAIGPLLGYLTSRTLGLPGDTGDIGNWGDWVGTVSLAVEAALILLSAGMLTSYLRARGQH
jgi:hypothetical protein